MTSIDENKKMWHKLKNGRISIEKVTKNVTQNFGVSVKDKMLFFNSGYIRNTNKWTIHAFEYECWWLIG